MSLFLGTHIDMAKQILMTLWMVALKIGEVENDSDSYSWNPSGKEEKIFRMGHVAPFLGRVALGDFSLEALLLRQPHRPLEIGISRMATLRISLQAEW